VATSINDFAFDYEQFDFAHLLAVLPVVRTVDVGDATLTITSLELFEAGFAANLFVEQETEPPFAGRPNPEGPLIFRGTPAISARDDRGSVALRHPDLTARLPLRPARHAPWLRET
jgi:hypothetical protein